LFQRVFYYDCLHDIPRVDETEAELNVRVQEQKAFFDRVQSLPGFHVRLGSLSGSSRKLRQKEVDILLAVEMLEHAFRKNMTSATLLAGDLDFAPLIDSLVRFGTWVDILYDPKSVAPALVASADRGVQIVFDDYHSMCTPTFRAANPLPQTQLNVTWSPEGAGYSLLKSGRTQNGDAVRLYRRGEESVLFVRAQPHQWLMSHNDATVLENYFSVSQGSLDWESKSDVADKRETP
jgi:hypothetical protein